VSLAPGRGTRYAPAAFSALALGCAVWWGSRQQLPTLPDSGAAWRLLAGALALYAVVMLLRCERWHQMLVRTGVRSTRVDAYGLVAVGYMANNALVARAGDVLKAALTARVSGAGAARVVGLAVGERALDAGALIVLFGAAELLDTRLGLTASTWMLRGVAIAGVIALVLVAATGLARATRVGQAVCRQVISAAVSLRPLAGPAGVGLLTLSVGLWLLEAGVYLAVGRAMGVRLDLPAAVQLVTLVNLGTFDAAVLFATRRLASGGSGLAYVLALRLVLFVPITLVGLIVLVTRHGGLQRLRTSRPLTGVT
jgi:glycosyltransferase 2 family protein